MSDARDQNQDKGDEVLRRLLKTPPDPKTGKGGKPHVDGRPIKGDLSATSLCSEGTQPKPPRQ